MRRSDKEIIDQYELSDILNKAVYGHLGLCNGDKPYIIPMNFVYLNNYIYLHSANDGYKFDLLKLNNSVCFSAETGVELVRGENPCNSGMRYKSVIIEGEGFIVEDKLEKIEALNLYGCKYSDINNFLFPEAALASVTLIRIVIGKISGKKSPANS